MSTEYYLVCPDQRKVLELYKEHQYLYTLNSIDCYVGGYESFLKDLHAEDWFSPKYDAAAILTKVIAFLKDCDGEEILHLNDNEWIDWWYENIAHQYDDTIGIPGMSKAYPDDWTVYYW